MARRSTSRSRPRRRNYLINPAFQWKYTLALGTAVFLAASMMGIALFGSLQHQARAKVLSPPTADSWQNARTIVGFAVAFSAVTIAALGCWGIVMTHRVSGPMWVLQRHLAKLSAGRFPKRRPLRKRDEFKEIHETFWIAVDCLKAQRQAELATLTDVLNTAASAAKRGSEAQASALESIATRIETLRNAIAEALEQPVANLPAAPRRGKRSPGRDALEMAQSNA